MMNTMSYDWIKETAKANGKPVTSLLALAPQNDPFYAGTPVDQKMAAWFLKLWMDAGYQQGVHLRRAHYWAVSRRIAMHSGEPYENTDSCWKYLTQAAKVARYLGVIPIESIIDNKNPDPIINAYYWGDTQFSFQVELPEDPFKPTVSLYGPHRAEVQPYHLELYIEKGTMNDVLEPVCRRFNANLNSFQGEASITSVRNLAERIRDSGKPAIIMYISDFDPAGKSMPVAVARKLEYMLSRYSIDNEVYVKALALNEHQVRQYKLPRIPIKDTERRAGKFEEAFGAGATELDALEAIYPGVLAQIVTAEFRQYFDTDADDQYTATQRQLRTRIDAELEKITARFRAELEAAREAINTMRTLSFDTSEFEPEAGIPEPVEEESMLFSSLRTYQDQISHYWLHKGRDE